MSKMATRKGGLVAAYDGASRASDRVSSRGRDGFEAWDIGSRKGDRDPETWYIHAHMERPVFLVARSGERSGGEEGRRRSTPWLKGVWVLAWILGACGGNSAGSRPSTDAAVQDAAADQAPEVRPPGVACPADDPTAKRPLGGCCATGDGCASGLCLGGFCTQPCAADTDCPGVATGATPLPAGTAFKCAANTLLPAASVCLPGSLAACGVGGTSCPAGESCSLVVKSTATAAGPDAWDGACTTKLIAGDYAPAGSACDEQGSPYQCETGGGILGSGCRAGRCTRACAATSDCPTGMFCDVPPYVAGLGGAASSPGVAGTTGVCLGFPCGHVYGTPPAGQVSQLGADVICPPGEVCGVAEAVGVTGDAWLLTCRPPLPGALTPGAICSAVASDQKRCASDLACGLGSSGARCGLLCRSDGDCPSGSLCVEDVTGPALPNGKAPVLAMCRPRASYPGQTCTREADCAAGQGCHLVSSRSSVAVCQASPGAAPVGAACKADADCRSGSCIDRTLLGPNGGNQTFCTSFCTKNSDCGAAQICLQSVRSNNGTPQDPTDDVLVGQCIPMTAPPNKGGCQADGDCALQLQTDERGGDTCDPVRHTCYKKAAKVGDACRYRAECPLDGTCINNDGRFRNGICARYGCQTASTATADLCPPGTACIHRLVDAPVSACFPACLTLDDCARKAEGYICDTPEGNDVKICEIGVGG